MTYSSLRDVRRILRLLRALILERRSRSYSTHPRSYDNHADTSLSVGAFKNALESERARRVHSRHIRFLYIRAKDNHMSPGHVVLGLVRMRRIHRALIYTASSKEKRMIYEIVGPTAAPFDRTPSLRAFPARYIVLDLPRLHPVLLYKAKRNGLPRGQTCNFFSNAEK